MSNDNKTTDAPSALSSLDEVLAFAAQLEAGAPENTSSAPFSLTVKQTGKKSVLLTGMSGMTLQNLLDSNTIDCGGIMFAEVLEDGTLKPIANPAEYIVKGGENELMATPRVIGGGK